jgi:hypothetical protein
LFSGIAEANKLPQVLTDDDFPTFTTDKIQLGQLYFTIKFYQEIEIFLVERVTIQIMALATDYRLE